MTKEATQVEVRNDKYTALLRNGCVVLSPSEENQIEQRNERQYPEKEHVGWITCVQLTNDFLTYGTASGSIVYYYLDVFGPTIVNEYCHPDGGIARLWPNSFGTRLIFEDDQQSVFVYNPVTDQALRISEFAGHLQVALWDRWDSHVFVLVESKEYHVYVYSHVNIFCPKIILLGPSACPDGLQPVSLENGTLTCTQPGNGAKDHVTLHTHTWLESDSQEEKHIEQRFSQNLALLHFKEAWEDALLLNKSEVWEALMRQALEQLELEAATKACQQSGNLKVLSALQRLDYVEDLCLLSGHVLVLLEEYDAAQAMFLRSSCPEAALEMRRNLQEWDQALALASQLGLTTSFGDIAREYAYVLEIAGDYRQALRYYEEYMKSNPQETNLQFLVQAGIARTSIHLGDLWKGKQIAMQCNNSHLHIECAKILEGLNLLQDAAEMYELGRQLEKAASIFITIKSFTKAQLLLEKIASPKLHVEFAKAMEAEKKYAEAAAAYEAAEDIANVVRLQLGAALNNPLKAFALLHKTTSIDGANVAAKYCKSTGDYEHAIEFLIMAKRTKEASELAQQHDKMDVYTDLVVDVATTEELLKLARYYETMGAFAKSAALFERSGEPKQALRLLLHWGTSAGIDQAIDMIGRLRRDTLTTQLVDFLMGDMEGAEKSPKYLFRLHTVLGNYEQATKVALLIAQQEQEMGNYKIARQQLLDVCQLLQAQNRRVPHDLSKQLMLLHSYILVKTLIRHGDHRSSARMLIRVAKYVSKFPAHVVQILISTVVECQRSGLKKSAFEYAAMLMRPEFRQSIPAAYKRKIENIVRKPDERTEDEEPLTPCPVCTLAIPETQLECPICRTSIPFCIASGRHMVLDNWTECPHCKFPALLSQFRTLIAADKMCPMCMHPILDAGVLQFVSNPFQLQLG